MSEPEHGVCPPPNPMVRLLLRIAARRRSSPAEHRVRARQLHRNLADFPHGIGLYVEDLATGECIEYRADHRFPAVDFRELALMIGLFDQAEKGRISLTGKRALPRHHRGPGPLQSLHDQPVLSVSDYCRLMVIFRDAAAGGMLEEIIGPSSRHGGAKGGDAIPGCCFPNTPRRLAGLLERLVLRNLITRNASDRMVEILHLECERRRNTAAFELPLSCKVAHSSGASPAAHAEAAVLELPLRKVVLALFVEDAAAAASLSAPEMDLLNDIVRWAQALPPPPAPESNPPPTNRPARQAHSR